MAMMTEVSQEKHRIAEQLAKVEPNDPGCRADSMSWRLRNGVLSRFGPKGPTRRRRSEQALE
jgi:hypothetical protein